MRLVKRPRPLHLGFTALVAVIAMAVSLQAQRVSGQDLLEDLNRSAADATRESAELRAEVAAAESPAEVLDAAAADGMVQPAAVVAIPAAVSEPSVPDGAPSGPLG